MPRIQYPSVRFAISAATLALAACAPRSEAPPPVTASAPETRPTPPPPTAAAPIVRPGPPRALVSRIQELGRAFDGKAGIAVRHVEDGWVTSYNGAALYPQQSVSKLWVAMTALDLVDRGKLDLDAPVTVRTSDLTVFHQPIRGLIGKDGYRTTIGGLLEMALMKSDNTANDIVLNKAGGPAAVRAFITAKGLGPIRFGPGEKLLQAGIAGLDWKSDYSQGINFINARAKLPMDVRKAAIERYIDDPIDGASPLAVADTLARLRRGELLSSTSTAYLLRTMGESVTGAARLKAGSPKPWLLAHKTGTGQELGTLATGFNDIGLMTAPNGEVYAVAVFIGASRTGIATRQKLIADVARAVVALHQGGGASTR